MIRFLLSKKFTVPLVLALVVGLGASHYWMYNKGQDDARLALLEQLDTARLEQARLTDELEEARQGRQAAYRDRIRDVYRAPDPSGCADVRAPDGVLDTFGYVDRPEADVTDRAPGADGTDQP